MICKPPYFLCFKGRKFLVQSCWLRGNLEKFLAAQTSRVQGQSMGFTKRQHRHLKQEPLDVNLGQNWFI